MRNNPSDSASIIGRLNHGANVTITGESGDWYKIESGSLKGYASKEFITIISYAEERLGTVTGASSLKVRSGPGTSYSRITSISEGTKVTILSQSDGWYKIRLSNGTTGYCSAEYIKVSSSGGSSDQPSGGSTGTVNVSSSLNVRSGPGTSYSVVASLSNNAKVTVLKKESNGWYYIRTASGKTGYVSGEYIKLDGSQSSQAPSESRQGKVKLSSSSSRLNVRSNASMSAGIIGKLSDGAAVSILGESGDWYKIKYNQTTGYVSKEFIQI